MLNPCNKLCRKKGSAISVPFFLLALVILLSSKWGPLTWPGAFAAVSGIVLAVLGWNELVVADGFLSAATSFTAQSFVGICPSCTTAAVCFAVAGILAAVVLVQRRALLTAVLVLPLIVGLFLFAGRLNVVEESNDFEPIQIVTQEVRDTKNVPKLYFSPWCDYCEEPLREFVKKDPDGKTWQPVVVPHFALSEGEKIIRAYGYKGEVQSAPESPSSGLPCLELPDSKVLTGKSDVLNFKKE